MNITQLLKSIAKMGIPYDVELRIECWSDSSAYELLYIEEEHALYIADKVEYLAEAITDDYYHMGLTPTLRIMTFSEVED